MSQDKPENTELGYREKSEKAAEKVLREHEIRISQKKQDEDETRQRLKDTQVPPIPSFQEKYGVGGIVGFLGGGLIGLGILLAMSTPLGWAAAAVVAGSAIIGSLMGGVIQNESIVRQFPIPDIEEMKAEEPSSTEETSDDLPTKDSHIKISSSLKSTKTVPVESPNVTEIIQVEELNDAPKPTLESNQHLASDPYEDGIPPVSPKK